MHQVSVSEHAQQWTFNKSGRTVRAGRLRTALDHWTADVATLYSVYPSRQFVVPKVRTFVDFLVEEFTAR
jgi:DNA-binding transcriptional LysR family regulator